MWLLKKKKGKKVFTASRNIFWLNFSFFFLLTMPNPKVVQQKYLVILMSWWPVGPKGKSAPRAWRFSTPTQLNPSPFSLAQEGFFIWAPTSMELVGDSCKLIGRSMEIPHRFVGAAPRDETGKNGTWNCPVIHGHQYPWIAMRRGKMAHKTAQSSTDNTNFHRFGSLTKWGVSYAAWINLFFKQKKWFRGFNCLPSSSR